jgi:formylglycine-generating enzyme required for sulfatase activity
MKNPIQEKPIKGSRRVSRGGSWISDPEDVRVSSRGSDNPARRLNYLSFRIVRNRR